MHSENFVETNKNIGDVVEDSQHDITYWKRDSARNILSFKLDCDQCTAAYDQGPFVILRYTAGKIQPQIFEQGLTKQPINRGITVEYTDYTTERLTFTGNIVQA